MSEKLNTIYGSADFLDVLKNEGIIPQQTAPIIPTDNAPVPILPNIEGEPGSGTVKLNLQGDVMSGPNPGITSDNTNSFGEIFSDYVSQADKWSANPYEKAKPFAWGSNEMNENFYRFYNHPRYKDLGFSPFRDNETFYNENSSAWDDFGRTFGAWKNLFGTAFKSSILFGAAYDGGSDQMAREFIDANNQGASTRGGIAGFANNLVLNSAYTVGLVTALTAENLAIAGTTFGLSLIPGGQGAAVAAATTGVTRNIYGLGKIAQGLKLTSQSLNFVRNLNKVDNARDFYNMAKNGTVAVGKFLNPLEESTQFIKGLSDLKKTTDLTKNYALMGRGVGSFYVDMRNIYVAYSEGALEGGMVKKELGDKFISDYYEKNGIMPEGEAADKIYNNINEAKANTTLYNLPIILYTNKIVLPNFSKLFPTFAKTAGTIAGETSQNVFKQAADWKLGKDFYQQGVKTFRDKATSVITKGVTPWSLRYVKANVGEGVQELYQEGLAAGIEDYYTSVYSDPAYAGFIESASKAVNSQISKQGLEVFASGFLMGGLIQGPQTLVTSYIPKKIFQYTKPEQYKQTIERAEQKEVENMNSANVLLKNILGFTENNLENAVRVKAAAETMDRAILEGRQGAFQNAQDDLLFEHTFNLLRNGRTELLTDAVSSFKTMKDEELSEAFEVDMADVSALRKRLDSSLNQISNLDQQYKDINKKWIKPDILNVRDSGEGPAIEDSIKLSRYHDFAVKMLLFNRNAFQRSLERKESILRNLNSDNKLKDLSDFDFNTLADEMLGTSEMVVLGNQIQSLKLAEKPDTKEISKLESKLDLLNKFWNGIAERKQISKDDIDGLEENERLLFNLYKDYLNQNAKRKGQPVFNDQIKKSFIDLMDTHVLTEDSLDFANQINILDSPEWFYDVVNSRRFLTLRTAEKYKNQIDKGYDEFKRIEKVNNLLLTKLDEKNFFLLADQINNYVRNNVIPTEIYDSNTRTLVQPGTPRYDEAQAIIAEILEEEVKAEQAVKEAAEKEAKSIIEKLKNINSSVLLKIQRNNYSIIEFDDLDENQKTALKKLRIGASDKELDELSKTLQLKRIDEQINQEFVQLFKELDTIYKSIYNKPLGEYIKEVYGKDPKGTTPTNVLRYYFALYSPAGQELIDKYNENKPDDQKISKPSLEVVEEQAPVTKTEEEVVTPASVVTPAPTAPVSDKKANIEKQKEQYKKMTKGTPIHKDSPKGIKIGDKYDDILAIISVVERLAINFDKTIADDNGLGYEVISKIKEYGEMENGVQTKAPKIEVITFNNKADADAFFVAEKAKLDKHIADAELAASGTATKADIERRRQEELTELGQKQLTKGFNSLSEATKPEQVANAIVNIEQNKNQGALLSKEQEQTLSEARAKLKEQVLKQIDEIVTLLREAQSKLDEKLFEQANAIVSDINYNTNATEEQRTYVNEIYDQAVKILEVAPMIEKNKNVTLTGGITYQIIKVNPVNVMIQKVKIVNGIAEITGTPEKVNKLELAQNIVKPEEITITKQDETNAQDPGIVSVQPNKVIANRTVFLDNIQPC